ncbi:MAG: phosphonate ABC transporter ATP-binding protein [Chloroflexota bacterium]|nr:phosphonate ABC transporter ATP-binding protein [Chloroflexota bacterium]
MTAIIQVQALTKRYSEVARPALDGVSFSVEAGSLTTILGRSGSGKTTLFRCLNLLVRPTSGQIRIGDQDWLMLDAHALCLARRQMATIFQQFNLITRLTVIENVLASQLSNVPFWRAALRQFPASQREWAMYCLERVGLSEYAHRPAGQLSGGQQQRVAIARALAQRSRIILADEPVASLDPETSAEILEELRAIVRDDGLTVLCSLHQESLALHYADRVIGLVEGRLVVDTPATTFTPAHRATIYQPGDTLLDR